MRMTPYISSSVGMMGGGATSPDWKIMTMVLLEVEQG